MPGPAWLLWDVLVTLSGMKDRLVGKVWLWTLANGPLLDRVTIGIVMAESWPYPSPLSIALALSQKETL